MGVDLATYRAKIGTFRRLVGLDVVTIVCNVNLTGGLKTVGSVLFIGILLLIAGIESNPGPPMKNGGEEPNISTNASILVTGIPDNVDEDFLAFFFGNTKKQGGGKVKRVTLDNHGHTAVVNFEEPGAVLRVIEKLPIIMLGTVIGVATNDTQGRESQVSSINSPSSGTNESECQGSSGLSSDQQSRESAVPASGTRSSGSSRKWSSFTSVLSKGASFFQNVSKSWLKEDKRSSTERKFSREDEISSASDELTEAKDTCHSTRIFVSGIPENASEEQLIITFNSIVPFNGSIKQLDFNAVDLTAIMELDNSEAVERVTKMSELHLDEKTVSTGTLENIDELKSKNTVKETTNSQTIWVTKHLNDNAKGR